MTNKNYEINNESILIRTTIPFISLIEMEICHDLNAHSYIKLCVLVDKENQEEILNMNWLGTVISVYKNNEEPLFIGGVEKLICHKENQLLQAEIRGISGTVKLDRYKKKQSFQDIEMTYCQVVQKIISDYKDAEFIWNIGSDKAIGSPIIQYDETDWEFLRRLCSHFQESLTPDIRTGKPVFSFGRYYGEMHNTDRAEIISEGFDSVYYQNGSYENGMVRSQAFYLEIKAKENWQMGDRIIYEGQNYHVYKRKICFKQGELFFTYRLGMNGVYYQKKICNPTLAGLRLEGTVKKVNGERVCLQLDIDKETRADYLWVWAPETSNLCYCMPEVETKAILYLPTQEEKEGRVILSTVKNFKNENYTDTQKREFITNQQRKIALYPDRIFMEGENRNVSLSMIDQSGIHLKSNSNISFQAGGEIYWSGKNVTAIAPMEITCKTVESNIELCRDINFYAPEGVKTIGTDTGMQRRTCLHTERKIPKQERGHWQISFSAIAAIPAIDMEKIAGEEDIVDLYACGGIPKVAKGSTVIALSEVMDGKRESETSFPDSFQSMDNYTVKGGYLLPE